MLVDAPGGLGIVTQTGGFLGGLGEFGEIRNRGVQCRD